MFVEKENLLFITNGILYKQVNGGWAFITHLPEDQPYVDAAGYIEQKTLRPYITPKEYPLGILCLKEGFYTLDNGRLKKVDIQQYELTPEEFYEKMGITNDYVCTL